MNKLLHARWAGFLLILGMLWVVGGAIAYASPVFFEPVTQSGETQSGNPCNPCAGQNPCNPCADKNPCNPCAGKNPCNPCAGQNPCNPCNPCGGKKGKTG